MKIEQYKSMVLGNLQGLVDWKVRREHKHFQWSNCGGTWACWLERLLILEI